MITSLALTALPAPLVAALLCGHPTAAPQSPGLLAALPSDTVMAVRLPNPKALMAQRETSSWVAFAMDAQWDVLLPQLFMGIDEAEMAAEAPAWRRSILGALGDSSEVVGFLAGPVEEGTKPTAGLLVRGGEECSKLLQEFMGADSVEASIPGAHTVAVSEAGRAELFYEKDGLMLLLSSDSVERSKRVAASCLGALSNGEALAGPFAIPSLGKVRQPGAAFEMAIDLRPIWEMASKETLSRPEPGKIALGGGSNEESGVQQEVMEELLNAASSMEWIYLDWELGLKEASTMNVHVPYDADTLAGEVFGFFGSANPALFRQVPSGAISATVASVDVHGMTTWALGQVKEFSEEAYGQVQGGLAAGQAALGLDIVEDIIANMTGDFLGFSSVPDTDNESGMLMAMAGTGPMTLVTMIEDADPLLELVEAGLAMSGMESQFASDTLELGEDGAELELWKASEEMGLPLSLGVGDGRLFISLDGQVGDAYLELLKGGTDVKTITADKVQREAMESASGSIITWQPTGSGADIMESLAGLLEGFVADEMSAIGDEWEDDLDEEDLAEIEESLAEMSRNFDNAFTGIASLWRDYFKGTVMTEVHLDGGMIRMRSVAR